MRMKHLEQYLTLGMRLDNAALLLIENAPACIVFNGILIRAKYKTTRHMDIVNQWHRVYTTEAIVYKHSPAYIKHCVDNAARTAANQAKVDAALARLWPTTSLNFNVASDVLTLLESIVDAADDVDVVLDMSAVKATFAAYGWETGANCGPYFNADDARNVAGWIVGQWFHCRHPMAVEFIKDWRMKFLSTAEVA